MKTYTIYKCFKDYKIIIDSNNSHLIHNYLVKEKVFINRHSAVKYLEYLKDTNCMEEYVQYILLETGDNLKWKL